MKNQINLNNSCIKTFKLSIHYLFFLLLILFQFSYGQDSPQVKKLIGQALEYEQNGDIENAITTHKKILDINAGSYKSANAIAGLYGQLGDAENEIIWAQKSIKINPKFPMGYINLGNGYTLKSDFDKAIINYKKADELDPLSPLAPYSLGVIEENKGNLKTAVSYYEQSVSRDKTFENGYFNLAAAYANLKDWKNANKNILKVLELNPNAMDAQEMHKQILKEISK